MHRKKSSEIKSHEENRKGRWKDQECGRTYRNMMALQWGCVGKHSNWEVMAGSTSTEEGSGTGKDATGKGLRPKEGPHRSWGASVTWAEGRGCCVCTEAAPRAMSSLAYPASPCIWADWAPALRDARWVWASHLSETLVPAPRITDATCLASADQGSVCCFRGDLAGLIPQTTKEGGSHGEI